MFLPKDKPYYISPYAIIYWLGQFSMWLYIKYWAELHLLAHQDSPITQFVNNWDEKLVQHVTAILRGIWASINAHIHGTSWQESKKKLWERVQVEVWHHYSTIHNTQNTYDVDHSPIN